MTKVVLRADVSGVGKKGDILDLADGFARNYLVPRGQALVASAGIEAQANAMRRSRDVKDGRERETAEQVARTLVPAVIALKAKTSGSQGKLFGSVTTADLVEAVAAQTGITLDKRTSTWPSTSAPSAPTRPRSSSTPTSSSASPSRSNGADAPRSCARLGTAWTAFGRLPCCFVEPQLARRRLDELAGEHRARGLPHPARGMFAAKPLRTPVRASEPSPWDERLFV